jgi:Legionella pneumophila major outer membrane protein precursor.
MGKYMSNIKRLSLALVALGLSAPAFADSTVLVPSQHGGFKVGIDALYLRPTNSHLDYATVVTTPANFLAGYDHSRSIQPSFDWGVYAQIGYLFPCTGNDLTLGYTYLSSNENDSLVAPTPTINGSVATSNGVVTVVPLSFIAQNGFGGVEAKESFTLNVVDLEGGQRFTTGSYDMRMFAGLRYANINGKQDAAGVPFQLSGVTSGVNTTVSGDQEFKSQFNGLGPRIGVDARYCLSSGFGLDADLSTSLLAGTVDSDYYANVSTNNGGTITTTHFATKGGSDTRLMPVLEAKLGVDYTYITDCRCKSSLVFEAGYQATNYFNTSDKAPVDSGSISARGTSDVAFDGPYLGVKYYA